jgi:hypothetical protein
MPEWDYAEVPDLMNVELSTAVDKLSSNEESPFLILDIRD